MIFFSLNFFNTKQIDVSKKKQGMWRVSDIIIIVVITVVVIVVIIIAIVLFIIVIVLAQGRAMLWCEHSSDRLAWWR